jgi:hypothetical protein
MVLKQMSHHEDALEARGQLREVLRLMAVQGQRLFTENIFACQKCSRCDSVVALGRCGDDDYIYGRIVGDLVDGVS